MPTRPRKYIWVNKEYFGIGLTPLDILILSHIEEETTHKRCCELTNNDFADMFSETLYAVKKSLAKLRDKEFVLQDTRYLSGAGKATKKRYLVANNDIGKVIFSNLDEYIERTRPKKRGRPCKSQIQET